jgi:DNA-binding transcriptional regulator YiaG
MTNIDYRYDACGLDNVILKGLPVVQADDGEEVITIPNVGLLHRVLTVAVASKDTGLQPKELKFLRTEMGLTQAELAALVGKEVQAIGRWERGENPIDKSAEIVIRARALQEATQDLPPMGDLARRTVKAASEPPILIDASNPNDYQPLLEAA